MKSNLDKVKKKLKNGDIALGTVVSLNDPEISEILCSCGFDFVWIDAEHGPLDKNMINMHIMAVAGAGAAPFVRVAWNDSILVKPILDMGPAGIIFPCIRTAQEAKEAVSACRYPPGGIRSFGPRRANNYSNMDTGEYIKRSESVPLIMLQIEHIDGVNNLEEIINTDGVDMIVVGPNDLSGSMGLLGKPDHPDVVEILDRISSICKKEDMPFFPATGYGSMDSLSRWIKRGASMLALDWDIGHIIAGSKLAIDSARKVIEESGNK